MQIRIIGLKRDLSKQSEWRAITGKQEGQLPSDIARECQKLLNHHTYGELFPKETLPALIFTWGEHCVQWGTEGSQSQMISALQCWFCYTRSYSPRYIKGVKRRQRTQLIQPWHNCIRRFLIELFDWKSILLLNTSQKPQLTSSTSSTSTANLSVHSSRCSLPRPALCPTDRQTLQSTQSPRSRQRDPQLPDRFCISKRCWWGLGPEALNAPRIFPCLE